MGMAMTGLPKNGELRLGDITLPPGHRVTPEEGPGPVAWVTRRAVPRPGETWAALRALHGQTGLVPLLLPADQDAPAEGFYFYDPAPSPAGQVSRLDAAGVLAGLWDSKHAGQLAELAKASASDPEPQRKRGLIGQLKQAHHDGYRLGEITAVAADSLARHGAHHGGHAGPAFAPAPAAPPPFPGLAPAQARTLGPASLQAALAALEPARIGLVEASRAADALAVTGWGDFDGYEGEPTGVWLGAVLRSWEDRFGAYLLGADDLRIRLVVERPPQTTGEATAVAAEHWAACESCGPDAGLEDDGRYGRRDIPGIAAVTQGCALWTLAWD
jgi:hypothetical protein